MREKVEGSKGRKRKGEEREGEREKEREKARKGEKTKGESVIEYDTNITKETR